MNVLTLGMCKCDECMRKTKHPGFQYVTRPCGCLYCCNCTKYEYDHRQRMGMVVSEFLDMIGIETSELGSHGE